ncbi:anti-sigma factor [Kitasatospora sp. NPDC003701]
MNAADLHTLTGAYAAHALDPVESAAFERHLTDCPVCAREVAEFAATLARLGSAAFVVPPDALRVQVLAALPTVRQDAPPTAPVPGGTIRSGRRPGGWTKLALAACLAAAAGAGGLAVQQHRQAEEARGRAAAVRQEADRLAGLLTAPDTRTATGAATGGAGAGTVVWSRERGRVAFLASGLPAPAAGTTYQLWFDDAGTMRVAGLLPGGDGVLLLTGPLGGARGVGVTVEPAGGSARPTAAPVLLLPLT